MDLAELTHDLETRGAVEAARDVAAIDALEVEVLGKKGRLTGVLRGIGALPADDRPAVGAIANTVRSSIEDAIAERRRVLGDAELEERLRAEAIDVTLPG